MGTGKLSSADHKVVTNQKVARTKVTSFINPSKNCGIELAKVRLSKNFLLYKKLFISIQRFS